MFPKVSIITPNYNSTREQFERSANSIDNQNSKDFEWIIVDDGSTSTPPFRYRAALGNNYGPSVARNVGVQVSQGDIITYLDMGDELYWDRVKILIELYAKYKVQLTFCSYNIVYPDNRVEQWNHFKWIGKTSHAIDHIKLLQTQNISIPLAVSHARKPFIEVGGFQSGIVCGEDGILWRRMIDRIHPTEIVFTDEVAGNYYVQLDSQARTQRRFEMGGFAIDGSLQDNGRYLDEDWYQNYNSKEMYERA